MLRRVEHNFGKWCHYSHVYWTGHSLVWNFFASNFNLNFMACPSVFLSFNKPCSFAARLIIWLLPFQPFQMLCVLKHVAFGNFNFFHITSRRENFDSLYANTLWWLIERSMAAWLRFDYLLHLRYDAGKVFLRGLVTLLLVQRVTNSWFCSDLEE